MKKNIAIIGSGFSSLSAACYLAKNGHKVTVFEKNGELGGRARQFKAKGFTFDMGPSWYWMPDVFDKFFNDFNKSTKDFYEIEKLNPRSHKNELLDSFSFFVEILSSSYDKKFL